MIGATSHGSRSRYAGLRGFIRVRQFCDKHARYEAEKAIWANSHPGSTPGEYESAIRAIAKACGV